MQSSLSLLNINTMASTYSNNNDADIDWDKLPQIENVRINYTDSKHALPGQGPYSYTYKVNKGYKDPRFPNRIPVRQRYSDTVRHMMTIYDARAVKEQLKLDTFGMQIEDHFTTLSTSDFYTNLTKIQDVYYQEMREFVQASTGADKVVVFDHNVRNLQMAKESRRKGVDNYKIGRPERKESANEVVSPAAGYARLAHNDYTTLSAPNRIRDLSKKSGEGGSYTLKDGTVIDPNEVEKLLNGRYIFINVWRNISETPIQKDPLGICASPSISDHDFIGSDLVYEDRVGQTYAVKHSDSHKWFYVSELRKNEAILLKCYDSNEHVARWTAHTSFAIPSTIGKELPPRESIETRCIAFFYDKDASVASIPTSKL